MAPGPETNEQLVGGALRPVRPGRAGHEVRGKLPGAGGVASNLQLVDRVRELADGKGISAGQLALAWVLAQGPEIVPIPGTTRPERVDENVAALDVMVTTEDLRALDELAPVGAAAGDRYVPR